MRLKGLQYPHITSPFRLFLRKIRPLKIILTQIGENLMIFLEKERSKVWTLRVSFREIARIFATLGGFNLGCYWLPSEKSPRGISSEFLGLKPECF